MIINFLFYVLKSILNTIFKPILAVAMIVAFSNTLSFFTLSFFVLFIIFAYIFYSILKRK